MYEVTTYGNTFAELRNELKNELTKAAASFVKIGYLLKAARDTAILEGTGYRDYLAFARLELGLDKTQVSRFIRINDRFSEGGNSQVLKDQYTDYGYTKLSIMLTLPENVAAELDPSMSKSEIEMVKEEVDAENAVTPIERFMEPEPEEGSILDKAVRQLGEDHTDIYLELSRNWTQSPESTYEILAPSEIAMYSIRISSVGRVFLKISSQEKEIRVVKVRENETETFTMEELIEALGKIVFPEGSDSMDDPKEVWESLYGKPFPREEEVAPVQRKPQKVTKAPAEKSFDQKQKEEERQKKLDAETKKALEKKEDEERMNAPLPSETRESIHEIKTAPSYFQAAMAGMKLFELRRNDRNYHVGDILKQREFKDNAYTGYELTQEVTFILQDYTGLEEGFCILGVKNLDFVTDTVEEAHGEES